MNHDWLAYRFGFVAYREGQAGDVGGISEWRTISLDGFRVHIHPEIGSMTVATSDGSALLIGDVFVSRGDSSVESILARMTKGECWDEFDDLSGRFALLLISGGECRVLHDPFGSRSIYYRRSGQFGVSSHASLLAATFSDQISEEARRFTKAPEYKARGTGYMPGDLTMYENINALMPNNCYDSGHRKAHRYWPRGPIATVTQEEFLSGCRGYFERISASLRGRYRPVLGVTGGVDTRAVIAGLMGNKLPLQLVTWTGGRLPDDEVDVVAEMVRHLGQPHAYMDPRAKPSNDRFKAIRKAADAATGFCRGESALSANMGELTRPGDVFVRGYGGEIIRGFYNRHGTKLSGDMARDFFNLYKTKRVADPSTDFRQFGMRAISAFIERANYDSELFNVDLRDLYYWEQRMGGWGANMHNEMDPAVYSITGLNSRPLYEAAFGLPAETRLGEEIMLKITAMYDRKFSEMGVRS